MLLLVDLVEERFVDEWVILIDKLVLFFIFKRVRKVVLGLVLFVIKYRID